MSVGIVGSREDRFGLGDRRLARGVVAASELFRRPSRTGKCSALRWMVSSNREGTGIAEP